MRRALTLAVCLVVVGVLFGGCVNPYLGAVSVEDIVSITDVTISYINSVWLTYVDVTVENILQPVDVAEGAPADSHTIKYATFDVRAYNRVGDPISEDIRDYYAYTCKYTGPLDMGLSESGTWEIGYFSGVDSVTAELKSVTMMDGSYYSTYDAIVVSSN